MIQIISDSNKKSYLIKSFIKKHLNKINFHNLNIVIGGDGFMLKTLKKINFQKYFYGKIQKLWFFNEYFT